MRPVGVCIVVIGCGGAQQEGCGLWYVDQDGDGYGDFSTALETCAPPRGAVTNGRDCDDSDRDRVPTGVYEGFVHLGEEPSPDDVDLIGSCVGTVRGEVVTVGRVEELRTLSVVEGALRITDADSLVGLSGLTAVGDIDLNVPDATSLHGLEGIGSITGDIAVTVGSTDLQGFPPIAWVAGDLTIRGSSLQSLDGLRAQVVDGTFLLSGLPQGCDLEPSSVRTVGSLFVFDTDLVSLAGLGVEVAGQIQISRNDSMASLGLDDLTTVTSLALSDLRAFRTFDGLASLWTVDSLTVENTGLTSFEGMEGVTITRRVRVEDVPDLESLVGLSTAPELVGVTVRGTGLSSLDGLEVTEVEDLQIVGNWWLEEVGLDGLVHVGLLTISENPSLEEVGLDGLVDADSISVTLNQDLTTLGGLGSLGEVGNLEISGCPSLVAVSGMAGLEHAELVSLVDLPELTSFTPASLSSAEQLIVSGCDQRIQGPPALSHVSSLELGLNDFPSLPSFLSLVSVDTAFIHSNPGITDLSGLESLRTVTDDLILFGDQALVDVQALHGVEQIGGTLALTDTAVSQASVDALIGAIGVENIGAVAYD